MCTTYGKYSQRSDNAPELYGAKVTESCEPLCGCLESNPGIPHE